MGAKAGSKQRKLPAGVAKLHHHREKLVSSSSEALLARLFRRLLQSSRRRKFYPFSYLFYYSPLKFLENGTFVVASVKRRTVFYGLTVLYAAIFVYRIQILVGYLAHNGLNLIGVLSSMYVLAMFAAACCCYGVVSAQVDMRQLLNQSHPQCMRQVCGLESGMFSTLSFWLKRAGVSWISSSVAFDASLFGLFFDSVPVCVYPILKGMIPNWGVPALVWKVVLYPVEVLTVVPFFAPALISLITSLIGLTVMKGYVENLSKMTIPNFEDWGKVVMEYRCAMVYNQILIPWLKNAATPAIVAVMFGMIGSSYVTLTSVHRLPFLIYVLFPVSFMAMMGIFTLACMDAVNTKTIADNVIGSLRSRSSFYRLLSQKEKKEFLLRCKALRPASLPVGNFTELGLNVPIYVLGEVLNQLLFLLAF